MSGRSSARHIVIAGVGKSGTTSLFHSLGTHPEICPATVKETHFFSPLRTGQALPPLAAYDAFFPHHAAQRYRLEASPDYCIGGRPVRDALRDHLGDPGIIIALRDPIERLHDNYWYMKSKGGLPGVDTFDGYVERRLAARARGLDRDPAAPHTGWIRSFYGDYLGPWFDEFGRDLQVVFFEQFVADPVSILTDLFTWLDIDPSPARRIELADHNATQTHRFASLHRMGLRAARWSRGVLSSRPAVRDRIGRVYFALNGAGKQVPPPMHPATRRELEAALEPSTRALARLLEQHGYEDAPSWVSSATTTGSAPA